MALEQKRKERRRKVLALADLHGGSAYALFPSGFQLSTGAIGNLNPGQEYLWECWQHLQNVIPRKLDLLLLDGDMIHGINPREEGADLTEQDPEWQQRAMLDVLLPIARRAKEVRITRGTVYHAGIAGRSEEQLAKALGAFKDPVGHHAPYWWRIDLDGVYIDLAHHQSVTIRYGMTPLEREIQFALMRAAAKGENPPDIVIRAHTHVYRWLNDDGFLGLSLPAWQLQPPYCQGSISPNRKDSRLLGGVLLTIWPDRKAPEVTNREDFIDHRLIWYNQPQQGWSKYGQT